MSHTPPPLGTVFHELLPNHSASTLAIQSMPYTEAREILQNLKAGDFNQSPLPPLTPSPPAASHHIWNIAPTLCCGLQGLIVSAPCPPLQPHPHRPPPSAALATPVQTQQTCAHLKAFAFVLLPQIYTGWHSHFISVSSS